MNNFLSVYLSVFLISAMSFTINHKEITIEWTENLKGDFSFYPKQTLSCQAWCYEFAGTSEIEVKRLNKDSIECSTTANIATHSTLHFYIKNNVVTDARIELNSIAGGNITYPCNAGTIKIDRNFMKKNILKADFDMKFDHPENPEKIMYWKGKIMAEIK